MKTEVNERREVGVAFIENYFTLAAYSHRVTAKTIYLRFRRSRDSRLRKILIAQLFEEYASAFESLAVLCHSLRSRFESDFLTSFVSYRPGIVRSFYQRLLRDRPKFDASAYLLLPSARTVAASVNDPAIVMIYVRSLPLLTKRLRETAPVFGVDDFMTLDIFTKLKHSSVFFDDATIADRYLGNPPGTCGNATLGDRVYILTGRKPKHVPILDANDVFAHKLYWNLRMVSQTLGGILTITVTLHRYGMLFVRQSSGTSNVGGADGRD